MARLPNFDCMESDDLMALWIQYRDMSRAECARLLGGKPKGYTGIGKTIAGYISNKATAMSCRRRGDIRAALMYEGIADRIYDHDIPAKLRW